MNEANMNNTNNNVSAQQEQKPVEYKLMYDEYEPFSPTKAEKLTTTQQVAKLLNARLKEAFQDYKGCFIEPAQNGGISVTLLFNQLSADKIVKAENPDDQIAVAFMPVEAMRAGGSNIAERSRALSQEMNNGRRYNITAEAKSAFGDLISAEPKKINWNAISGEGYQRQAWAQEGYCWIKNIDIVRALEIIFGAKDKDTKARIYYNPMILAPVSNAQIVRPNNWIMDIQMMTDDSSKSMCDDMGIVSTGLFNCVTA